MSRIDPIVLEVRAAYETEVISANKPPSSTHSGISTDVGSVPWLAERIYREFHSGSDFRLEHPGKNDMYDPDFSRRIVAATPAAEIWVPAQVPPIPEADGYIVTFNGVRVRMHASLVRMSPSGTEPASLRLPRLRPHLSPGYLYYSRAPNRTHQAEWRVYVSVSDLDSAVTQWAAVLEAAQTLTEGQYHAKVASTAVLYPRRDAIVVYFDHATEGQLQTFADRVTAGTAAGTSRLARTLAPGVSCAHEPRASKLQDAGASFGQHRSAVLARLLVEGAGLDEFAFRDLADYRFREANIDPSALHLNTVGEPR